MKATSVEYGRTKSDYNYGNTRVGLIVELEDGDTPEAAMLKAKAFVANALGEAIPEDKYLAAKAIVDAHDTQKGLLPWKA